MPRVGLLLVGLLLASSCSGTGPSGSVSSPTKLDPYRLLFWSNTWGQVNPCDCSIQPYGGLERRQNLLHLLKSKSAQIAALDGGNFLFPYAPLPSQDTLFENAEKTAQKLSEMGVLAINVGNKDLYQGLAYLRALADKHQLPLVSANIFEKKSGHLAFPAFRDLNILGRDVRVIGLSEHEEHKSQDYRVRDPLTELSKILKKTPTEKPIILLADLYQKTSEQLTKRFGNKHRLLVLGQRHGSRNFVRHQVDTSIVIEGDIKGQSIAVLSIPSQAAQISQWDIETLDFLSSDQKSPATLPNKMSFTAIPMNATWDTNQSKP